MSTAPTNHPSPLLLRGFLLGTLTEYDLDEIATHLEHCSDCCDLLEARDAPFLQRLRLPWRADPAVDSPTTPHRSTLPPHETVTLERTSVPGYRILRELGRGGIGVVYQARCQKLRRLVALKMLLAGANAGTAALARFQVEAEAVARLQHPNIVQIHEVGEHAGLPYFALEFCAGGNLAHKLAGTALSPAESAALVERLATAVQYAHDKGVLHRDLKPANILLTEEGVAKVTDFGLAKLLDAEPGEASGLTVTGLVLGTPSYMAPEQARGGKEVGPACDVYALGAVLFECLTGRPPFRAATALETVQQAAHEEPVPPRRLNPRIPIDLETICLTCLHKEPTRRYASATALAEDLRRFQTGVPIAARPAGPAERLAKWARRRPTAAALLAVTGLAAAVLVMVAVYFLDRLARERNDAVAAREQEKLSRQAAEQQRDRAEGLLYAGQLKLAQTAWNEGHGMSAQHYLHTTRPEYRGWEYRHLLALLTSHQHTLRGHTAMVDAVCHSPDGKRLATAGGDRTVKVWDLDTGREVFTIKDHDRRVYCVCFSRDGKLLATGGVDGTAKVWDAADGRLLHTFPGTRHTVMSVCFSRDGKRLATGGGHPVDFLKPGEARVWDVATGRVVFALPGPLQTVNSLCYSPDGTRLATASGHVTVQVWDADDGKELLALKEDPNENQTYSFPTVCYSPDGKRLATSSHWKAKVWDAVGGRLLLTLRGHTNPVQSVTFSPDGSRLATGSADQTVKLWDADNGQELLTLRGHTHRVTCVSYSPDGKHLASGSYDTTAKLWDAENGQEPLTLRGHTHRVTGLAFSRDGKRLATSGNDRAVRVWDVDHAHESLTIEGHAGPVLGVCFSPDGKRLAAAGEDHTVKVSDAREGREVFTLKGHTAAVNGVCYSPDGRLLATASDDKTVKVWDALHGRELRTLQGHTHPVAAVCFSPDGKRLATASDDNKVMVWDVATGRLLATLTGHTNRVSSVCFSPDGRRLATGSFDRTLKVWDVDEGREVATLQGHTNRVTSVCFCPKGKRLASGSIDRTVKIWDVSRGQEVLTLSGHSNTVSGVCFSPDGNRLATASYDRTVRVYDATPSE